MKKSYIFLIFLILLVIANLFFKNRSTVGPANVPTAHVASPKTIDNSSNLPIIHESDLPEYVKHTVSYLRSNNFSSAEPGYVGGRIFTNYEKVLPTKPKDYYKEWDVHPKQNKVNRGVERLVTGLQGEIYYTNTHYGDAGSPAFYMVDSSI